MKNPKITNIYLYIFPISPRKVPTGALLRVSLKVRISSQLGSGERTADEKKRVSYSLGEAHLSGGVRACGKVVLKGKQAL